MRFLTLLFAAALMSNLAAAPICLADARADEVRADYDQKLAALQLESALVAYQTRDYTAATTNLLALTQQQDFAQSSDAWLLLARAANRSGQPRVALDAIENVRRLGGPAELADLEAGKAKILTREFAEAADLLEQALLAGGQDQTLIYHLTVAYGMLGRKEDLQRLSSIIEAIRAVDDLDQAILHEDIADANRSLPPLDAFPVPGRGTNR
ncbi:MAG: hypothetical protein WD316_00040 [Phycisphaeraceae bacterium]